MNGADAADTTIPPSSPPPPRKATKRPAPDEPQQALGRKLRASTVAKSAAALEALVSLKPPPPRRRAPKLDSTKETVESAADAAAKPSSLLRQPKLPVVTHRSRTKTGWERLRGKSEEEKEAIRFVRAVNSEFRRMYERYVASVEGELNLSEETEHLVQGFFDSIEGLFDAMSGLEGVRPTDHRVNNLVRGALHVKEMARALAENELTGRDFMLGLAACSAAARRGAAPVDALAEFKAAIDVVVKKHANRDAYLLKTAEQGRRGRDPEGKDVRFDAEATVADRVYHRERKRATAAGKREPRYEAPTMETHALAVKTIADERKRRLRNRSLRIARACKAAGVATPKDCTPDGIGIDGVPLFRTNWRLVPPGRDNRPLIAEEAAARAVEHRAEKGVKTMAEKAADRRAGGLPDNVYPSKALCRAGQFRIQVRVPVRGHGGKKKAMSVAEPGTDGYYASTKAAADVLEEWIKKERPREWLVPARK